MVIRATHRSVSMLASLHHVMKEIKNLFYVFLFFRNRKSRSFKCELILAYIDSLSSCDGSFLSYSLTSTLKIYVCAENWNSKDFDAERDFENIHLDENYEDEVEKCLIRVENLEIKLK